jgi:hypothetical protein
MANAEKDFGYAVPMQPLKHDKATTPLTHGPVTNSEKGETNQVEIKNFDNVDQESIYESVADMAVDEELDDFGGSIDNITKLEAELARRFEAHTASL